MSVVTFNPNQVVYVIGIGYATLLSCPAKKDILLQQLSASKDKLAVSFDPELSNSHQEGPEHTQLKPDEEHPLNSSVCEPRPNSESHSRQSKERLQNTQFSRMQNIVKARLEGSNAFIFTSESNLSKSITVKIKPLLPNRRRTISITIDFSKTLDSLKKVIFEQMGEPIGCYYNIKLFATSPKMGELSTLTKTVHHYRIKDGQTLILTAGFAFEFRPLPQELSCKYKITINNNTLASCAKPPPEPKLPIALPPIPPLPVEGELKTDPPRQQQKAEIKDWQILPQMVVPPAEQAAAIEQASFLALSNIELESGRRYWEVKVEKPPAEDGGLIIGVCVPSSNPQLRHSLTGCSHIWAYYAGSGQKGFEAYDDKGSSVDEWQEEYGYALKPNDLLGVLAIIRGARATITFYINAISCGKAFDIELSRLEGRPLVPFIDLGGDSQVTLDPRAALPLDSYRLV